MTPRPNRAVVPEAFDALAMAAAGFECRLRAVRADQWVQPTPCSEWDVRALVNHVVGANVRYTMVLHGVAAAAVDATRTIDHLRDDAVAAFLDTCADMTVAFGEPGALDRSTHHPVVGDRRGSQLLAMRVLDIAVHSWDLASAVGVDDVLDPGLVEFALGHADSVAPLQTAVSGGSPQDRLLRQFGRNPTQKER